MLLLVVLAIFVVLILFSMPIVFALLMGLPASEWLLRRKWGVV